MPYRYLDDIAIADVAFEAWGKTREEMFIASADALLGVMVEEPGSVVETESIDFRLEEEELDMLLFSLLNELLFYKDSRLLLLHIKSATVSHSEGRFLLEATASGERIAPLRHPLNVDVKAVTLHRFKVEDTAEGYRAEVVLDI